MFIVMHFAIASFSQINFSVKHLGKLLNLVLRRRTASLSPGFQLYLNLLCQNQIKRYLYFVRKKSREINFTHVYLLRTGLSTGKIVKIKEMSFSAKTVWKNLQPIFFTAICITHSNQRFVSNARRYCKLQFFSHTRCVKYIYVYRVIYTVM